MNNEAEIKQHFNDTPANTIWIECNITQKNVSSPLGDINVKKEPIEYENAEQKIPTEKITFIQNIDSKPELLEFEDNSKITYNLDTQNVGDDFQSSNHHQFKFEKGKMDITPSETEVYDKECEKNERVSYCLKCAFKFGSDDIPPNTICIECNVAEKDVFPLAEKDTKSECLEIEDSKISYNLDSQNVHHQFESEDGQNYCMPPEPEVHGEEGVNNEKVHYCSKCVFKFDSKIKYTLHLKTQHIVNTEKKLFMCSLCGFESKHKSSIRRHMNMHTIDNKHKAKPVEGYTRKAEMFKCNLCEYESKRRRNMEKHIKNVHKEYKCKKFVLTAQNMYKCKLCEYESKRRSTIYSHVFNKHDSIGVNKYRCPQCEYRTHSSTRMKRHLLMHDNIRSYECDVCNKRFRHKYSLKNHSWTHSSEKRLQCFYCDYKSNYKSIIEIHMKNKHVKQENKDYKCTQCPYETNIKSDLIRHVKKENKCKQCGYKTNCKANMRQHIQNHDNIKLYECNVCNKLFKREDCLKEHIRCVHLDEKNFHCAHCDYKTNYKCHLERHLKNHLMKIKNVHKVLDEQTSMLR